MLTSARDGQRVAADSGRFHPDWDVRVSQQLVTDSSVDGCQGLVASIGEVSVHHTGAKSDVYINNVAITSALMVAEQADTTALHGPLPVDVPAEFKLLVRPLARSPTHSGRVPADGLGLLLVRSAGTVFDGGEAGPIDNRRWPHRPDDQGGPPRHGPRAYLVPGRCP